MPAKRTGVVVLLTCLAMLSISAVAGHAQIVGEPPIGPHGVVQVGGDGYATTSSFDFTLSGFGYRHPLSLALYRWLAPSLGRPVAGDMVRRVQVRRLR